MIRRLLSRGEVILVVWGLILLGLWFLTWTIWHPDSEAVIMLSIASFAMFVWGALAFAQDRRRPVPSDTEPLLVTTTTHATSLVGIAIFGIALAFEFGPWLWYVSGGLLAFALAGLIREHLAARHVLQAIAERERERERRP